MEDKIITNIGNEIYKNKKDHYGSSDYDFVASNEITVTITLSEYRSLVTKSKDGEINRLNNEIWQLKANCDRLEAQVKSLKELINSSEERKVLEI